MTLTVSLTWQPVAEGLPDAELNVMLATPDLTFEGFLDGTDDTDAPIWRDVTALQVEGVTHWSEMPRGPND